ncbi:hypothetical protein BDQ12DRAFT_715473 [Crucibulum laeve]|uniref:Uncharacterized protein n=1 Tax=Crucibulum laeve TaxID=68775 RepID=A0A5C3LND5_9AGAR|nr:hypothetical protein BDQ12DRAFT_715473 [Crucibulum laeve]
MSPGDAFFYTNNCGVVYLIAVVTSTYSRARRTLCWWKKRGEAVEEVAKLVLWRKINDTGWICVTSDYPPLPVLFAPAAPAIPTLKPVFPNGALNLTHSHEWHQSHWARMKDMLKRSEGEIV